jgi:hypothetical protein
LGSPLDKFATLFPQALRPWHRHDRPALLAGGDATPAGADDGAAAGAADTREWWINFYHVFDPVSGALHAPLVCGPTPPVSIHTNWRASALVPGLAHTSYWRAKRVTRFILARTYGRSFLEDQPIPRQSVETQAWFAVVGYLVWSALAFTGVGCLFAFRSEILKAVWTAGKAVAKALLGL